MSEAKISCKAQQDIMLCMDYQLNSSIFPCTCCLNHQNMPNLTIFMYFGGWNLSFLGGYPIWPQGGCQIFLLLSLWIFYPDYVNPIIWLKSADPHVTPPAWSLKNVALKWWALSVTMYLVFYYDAYIMKFPKNDTLRLFISKLWGCLSYIDAL